ncbi:MAG: Rrf2 family transcriptional regulator [Acidobacteria bacterium]|nr:Rrf2 family transcriptional regulator [Acidobacteriota bacterium]
MQLTRAADYAVRIMIHMALSPEGSRHQKSSLAQAAEVPEHFVSKVLQHLKRSRLIESQRGMHGGFTLARAPKSVTMLDVIEAVQGPTILNICLSPGPSCNRKGWCPAHTVWVDAQEAMKQVLKRVTIAALARQSAQMSTITGGRE